MAQSVTLVPLLRKRADGSNARIEIAYRKGQTLAESLPVHIDGRIYAAKRVRQDVYGVEVPFNFEAFVEEQARRREWAPRRDRVPVFRGREIVDRQPLHYLDPSRLKEQIARGVPIQVEPAALSGFEGTILAGSSLMVTAVSVVEDPERTYDACSGSGNPNGAWTFGHLMENIANTPVTGIHAGDLVEDWIQSLSVDHAVNGFAVPSQPQRAAQLLAQWPRDSNNRLRMDRAPMRLLAIVNRIDLRQNSAYGRGNAGEGRFVFGLMRRNPDNTCQAELGTVILEYGIPVEGCSAIRNYGQQWATLGDYSVGSLAYNTALQAITDQFTSANTVPQKPNGSALNQLRLNDFPIFSPWELREYRLSASTHLLETVSTAMTPHLDTFNSPFNPTLGNFINANEALILQQRHVIPETYAGGPFLTGSAMNPFAGINLPLAWNPVGVANPGARHLMALNTCNGCHGRETGTSDFVHVANRNMGYESKLSHFLVGDGFVVNDPVHPQIQREFAELDRRSADLELLVSQGCGSGGFLSELQGVTMNAAH